MVSISTSTNFDPFTSIGASSIWGAKNCAVPNWKAEIILFL